MNILVIGGTGMVGSQTVSTLLARGQQVKVMTRSQKKLRHSQAGVESVVGDMEAPESLARAFKNVDRAFLITPLSPNETEQGLAAVETAKAAGVRRIVYMTVPMHPGSTIIPHFKSKIPVIHALRDSGLDYTILEPNNFFQNDLYFEADIVQRGIYPQPMGSIGLNRVDVRDIAEAAANALIESGHEGNSYPLMGPDVLTSDATARIWSRHLGWDVRYCGDDLDAWEEWALKILPDWMVSDFRIMYRYFQDYGLRASEDDFRRQHQILHHEPRPFEAFASELAPTWRSAGLRARGVA